jgi:hypothetical protein
MFMILQVILAVNIFIFTLLLSVFVISKETNKSKFLIFFSFQLFIFFINYKILQRNLNIENNSAKELVLFILFLVIVLIHGLINKNKLSIWHKK